MFLTFSWDGRATATAATAYPGIRRTMAAPSAHRQTPEERRSSGEGELAARARAAYDEAAHPKKPPEPALLASDILHAPVIAVDGDETLSSALRILREKGIGHLPVIDAQGRLAGMLSDSDMQALRLAGIEAEGNPDAVTRHMATPVLAASPDTDIRQIAGLMLERKVGSMPIVDDEGRPTGIITRTDLLSALIRHPALELYA